MTASPPDNDAPRRALAARRTARSRRLRRRIGAGARMIAALALVGRRLHGVRARPRPPDEPVLSDGAAKQGKVLYNDSCITCHGLNAQGVPGPRPEPDRCRLGRGRVPGRAPAGCRPTGQEAQIERKTPVFTDEQAQQIGAYIQALGGGPELPDGHRPAQRRRHRRRW